MPDGARAPIYQVALIGLAVLLVWLTLRVDLVIFAGLVLAVCLSRTAAIVGRKTGLPQAAAVLAVVLAIVVCVAAGAWFFARRLAVQFTELSQQLSNAVAAIGATIDQSPLGHPLISQFDMRQLLGSGHAFGRIFGVASNFIEVVAAVAVIVFVGVYGAADPGRYVTGLIRLVPPNRRPRARQILAEAAAALWYWVLGRLTAMLVLGCLTGLGLWALGVPAPIALGALAGLLTFVPYIGAFVSALPALLLSLAVSPMLAVYVAALYLALHAIEGYLLIPLVQQRAAHLPPALILAFQVILSALAGFLGLLTATPALAAMIVLVRAIYVEDVLGDGA